MIDIILMILFVGRFRKACIAAGQPVKLRNVKMIVFWLLAEVLILYSCLMFGMNSLAASVLSMAAGVLVGYLSYRQNIEGLPKNPPDDDQIRNIN